MLAMLTLIVSFSNVVFAGEIFGINDEYVGIPDPGYAVSTIDIDTFFDPVVRSVEIEFLIIHECWGDLTVQLTNGEGDSYDLFNGASNEDGGGLKINRSIPDFFDGVWVNGTWSLEVWDTVPNCSGYIDYWWIRIHYEDPDDDYYYFRSDGEAECFFSTAVAGSPLGKRLDILRRFRDKYLLSNLLGRRLVSLYYRLSPKMSHYILRHPMLKKPVRIFTCVTIAALECILFSKSTSKEYMSIVLLLCLFIVLFAQSGKIEFMIRAGFHSGRYTMAKRMIG